MESIQIGILKKVKERSAEKICQGLKFYNDTAKGLLAPQIEVNSYLKALIENQFFVDAVRFLSCALPKRESVWWACMCVRSTLEPDSLEDLKAVEAAENWVKSLSEESRLAAKKAADILEMRTAASWVAMAAFWSQGSLTPLDAPMVLAPEGLSAQAAAGAITLSAVFKNPHKAPAMYALFLSRGIHIANGGNGGE